MFKYSIKIHPVVFPTENLIEEKTLVFLLWVISDSESYGNCAWGGCAQEQEDSPAEGSAKEPNSWRAIERFTTNILPFREEKFILANKKSNFVFAVPETEPRAAEVVQETPNIAKILKEEKQQQHKSNKVGKII